MHLLVVFIKGSFQGETAFRFNFAANLLKTVLNLAGSIGGLAVVFYNKESLNGWGYREVTALLGVYLLILGLKDLVIGPGLESLSGLSGDLWTGLFDYTLLKPIPVQFHVSFRKWSLWSLIDIIIAVFILLASASGKSGFEAMNSGMLFLFPVSLLISLVLIYSVLLILASAAFWYLGTPLMWVFDSLIQTGRFPVGIYPGFLRILLTWLIPVGFIITVPAQVLSGMADVTLLAGGALLAVVLFSSATALFRLSLRKYASASS
jgi:ABC-2 type transport system permease protein